MRAWWQRRTERERTIVNLAAAALVLAVIVMLWGRAERSRARLAAELPALRASIATLERDAREVQRLRAMPARTGPAGAPPAALPANAGAVAGAQIVVIDGGRVRLTGADVAFGAVLEWLTNALATHGLRVESARLEALAAPGRVKADIILTRS